MALSDPVTTLKGVGPAKAQLLEKLGIHTLEDLITFFPRRYEDRTKLISIKELEPDRPACFSAMVVSPPRTGYIRKGLTSTRCTVADDSGQLRLTWFNQPWMRDNLQVGTRYCFYGTLTGDDRSHQMLNPVVEAMDAPPAVTRCIIPVYPLTKGLSSKSLQQLIFRAMEQEDLPDYLPPALLAGHMALRPAYLEVHHPTQMELLAKARRRLVFEEFFLFSAGMELMKLHRSSESIYPCPAPIPQQFFDALPFSLTGAQQRALAEISADLSSGQPMNRLLQGDVGSGKTLVALGAMIQVVKNGYQAALMAPTELLAVQHYHTLAPQLEPLGISCSLLTGSTSGAKRRQLLEQLASGGPQIVVGTHALFTEDVQFSNLGLVVIDEQHRFGVRQRAALAEKSNAPHMLVLSATPIPRTLALIVYGDLDVSLIDELPPGRKNIDTFLVSSSYHLRLQGFMKKQIDAGHQVYVVCPAVEDSETMNLTSAESMYETLCEVFPAQRVGLVHGRLRSDEKDQVMDAFLRRETDILVATTVIEVGVDVRNATLMVIENADRFGLSQLHQLRGRVGRNAEQSYCVLVSDNRNSETRKRLKALCETNDGFKIAEQDLALRGPGDFFGYRQSGLPIFRMASLAEDLGVLKEAQAAARQYLASNPSPEDPGTKRLFERIEQLFAQTSDTFN